VETVLVAWPEVPSGWSPAVVAAGDAGDGVVTRRLVAAAAVIGVELLAHLVVARDGWADCLAAAQARLAPDPALARTPQIASV